MLFRSGLDSSGRNELALLQTILPLALGIAGGVALLAGIFLARKPRDAQAASVAPEETQGTQGAGAVAAEPAKEQPTAELAGVVPGLDDGPQERAAEAPEGEGPDAPGARSAP